MFVVRPAGSLWSVVLLSALGSLAGLAYVGFHLLTHERLWIEGSILFGAAAVITALAAVHFRGLSVTVDEEQVVERRGERVLRAFPVAHLTHLERDAGGGTRMVFRGGGKVRLTLHDGWFDGAEPAREWLERRLAARERRRTQGLVSSARSLVTERARIARGARAAAPSAPRSKPRRAGRGAQPSSVQLPLRYVTFPDACVSCGADAPTESGDLTADISTTLQTLADQERRISFLVPLCGRCGGRRRRVNLALTAFQLVALGGLLVTAVAWANTDWTPPGWLWVILGVGFVLSLVLSDRRVDRRLSHRFLGVCVERYLGDASGRVVLRFRKPGLAAEVQRVTLQVQEHDLAQAG